jgi:feruloyl esterase
LAIVAGWVLVALLGAGCGGGGGSSGSVKAPPPPPPPPPPSEFVGAAEYCETLELTFQDFTATGFPRRASIVAAEFRPATGAQPDDAADTCRVVGQIPNLTTEGWITFELLMPDDWNLNLLFVGGGGFGGATAPPEQTALALGRGYAVVSTDMGHSGDALDASWAPWSEEARTDYYYDAIPVVAGAARAILAKRYEDYFVLDSEGGAYNGLHETYFEGCSGGGREALLAAQRAPELFDGIIARAPSLGGIFEAFNRNAKLLAATPLADAKLAALDAAQLAACDASSDGVADGIIDSYRCDFDPAALLCTGAPADDCLTAEELAVVQGIRSPTPLPYAQAHGLTEYPGWPVASVADLLVWPIWITRGAPPSYPQPLQFVTQEQTFRYLIANDPELDTLSVSAADYPAESAALSAAMDATSTDLSGFVAKHGKVILWHGQADAALSVEATRRYYEAVRADTIPGNIDGDDFLALYLAPGVFHCSGGPGADRVDLLQALEQWRGQQVDQPPPPLVAERRNPGTGALELSRPLCRYPQHAQYLGSGDPNDAASFGCVDPDD